jgi:glycyl-tRNA synthetase alpha subunit
MGIDPLKHDIRFVEDNWNCQPLGWGLVLGSRADGMNDEV